MKKKSWSREEAVIVIFSVLWIATIIALILFMYYRMKVMWR